MIHFIATNNRFYILRDEELKNGKIGKQKVYMIVHIGPENRSKTVIPVDQKIVRMPNKQIGIASLWEDESTAINHNHEKCAYAYVHICFVKVTRTLPLAVALRHGS